MVAQPTADHPADHRVVGPVDRMGPVDALVVHLTPAKLRAKGMPYRSKPVRRYVSKLVKRFDVTDIVTWSSDDEIFATVSNTPETKGPVTGVSVGVATIRIKDPQSGQKSNTGVPVVQE